jgi:hypothetical protein
MITVGCAPVTLGGRRAWGDGLTQGNGDEAQQGGNEGGTLHVDGDQEVVPWAWDKCVTAKKLRTLSHWKWDLGGDISLGLCQGRPRRLASAEGWKGVTNTKCIASHTRYTVNPP